MTRHHSFPTHRQGFTLIEIMVVLAIAAIVSSITLGGYKAMTQGNKRVSCQTNLVQIYQAARLYASDEGGKFPSYSNPCTSTPASQDQVGIGLWKLYTFPTKPEADTTTGLYGVNNSAPIERYIRSAKVFHCPNHLENRSLMITDTSLINQDFLSYQSCDGSEPTYSTSRTNDPTDPDWKRQLIHFNGNTFVPRQPTGDTIVTWCRFHRDQRAMDNVLFYDGTVQLIPQNQAGVTGWKRIPKPPV